MLYKYRFTALQQLNFISGQKEALKKFTCSCSVLPSFSIWAQQEVFPFIESFFFFSASSPAALRKFVSAPQFQVQEGKSQKLPHYSFLSPALQDLLSARFLLSCFSYTLKKIMAIKDYSRHLRIVVVNRSRWPSFTRWIYDCCFQHFLKVYLYKKKKRIGISPSCMISTLRRKQSASFLLYLYLPLSLSAWTNVY